MSSVIDDLVEHFDKGTLSRRQLVQGLTALAAAGAALPAAAQTTPFQLDAHRPHQHPSHRHGAVDRVLREIFGLKILGEDKENEIVRMGVTRIIVSLHRKPPVGIVDHFAIAIDDFNREAVTAELAKHGLTAEQNLDYGFYVRDPEGIPVQIVGT